MIVGGAQENTLLSCALTDPTRFPSEILSGPETGVEGDLHDEVLSRGVPIAFEPAAVQRLQDEVPRSHHPQVAPPVTGLQLPGHDTDPDDVAPGRQQVVEDERDVERVFLGQEVDPHRIRRSRRDDRKRSPSW
jgi:hypothetical protein